MSGNERSETEKAALEAVRRVEEVTRYEWLVPFDAGFVGESRASNGPKVGILSVCLFVAARKAPLVGSSPRRPTRRPSG